MIIQKQLNYISGTIILQPKAAQRKNLTYLLKLKLVTRNISRLRKCCTIIKLNKHIEIIKIPLCKKQKKQRIKSLSLSFFASFKSLQPYSFVLIFI